ncbi:MAG: AI-2E family transporter [Casimicrobiaceae bacterium]
MNDQPSARSASPDMQNDSTAPSAEATAISDGRIVRGPVNIRSLSLAVLAVISVIVFLRWAEAVLVPITFAVLAGYALMPMVRWLKRHARLPEAISAAVVLLVICGGMIVGVLALQKQALGLLELLPRAAHKIEGAMRRTSSDKTSAMERVKSAAAEIDKATQTASASVQTPTPTPTTPAVAAAAAAAAAPAVAAAAAAAAAKPSVKLSDYLWMGTLNVVAAGGQVVVVIALIYFLLVSGHNFKRKIVRISGDTLTKKKITVELLEEIDRQIQRYLAVQLATSALFGVLVGLAFFFIGLDNALFWGVAAGLLHLVPYVGPTATVIATALLSYLQFPTIGPALASVAAVLAIAGAIGFGLVPWLTGKVSDLNAVTVFVALLIWGWLWGIWGLLLGVPIVMALKAVCDRVEAFQPIAELLGQDRDRSDSAPTPR